jgi:hypothetical protein
MPVKAKPTVGSGGQARRQAAGSYLSARQNTTSDARCQSRDYPIYTSDGAHVAGTVCGDTFRKRTRPEHMLHLPRAAWAFDRAALDQAEQASVTRLEVLASDGAIYRAALAHFRRFAFPVNRGAGAQWALELRFWDTTRGGVTRPGDTMREPPKPQPAAQMSLFNVGGGEYDR